MLRSEGDGVSNKIGSGRLDRHLHFVSFVHCSVNVADVDLLVPSSLNFRVLQHPSENVETLLKRTVLQKPHGRRQNTNDKTSRNTQRCESYTDVESCQSQNLFYVPCAFFLQCLLHRQSYESIFGGVSQDGRPVNIGISQDGHPVNTGVSQDGHPVRAYLEGSHRTVVL